MRLNRYLAAAGYGSRRSCEDLIRAGRVSINGHFIRELATVVGDGDDVRVAGEPARKPAGTTVLVLHKPKGFVTTREDERGRRTIYHLLPPEWKRLAYVGRLDRDSEGLVLLTDDGELNHTLTHPSRKIEKEYEVLLDGPLESGAVEKLLRGFRIEAGRARMESVRAVAPDHLRVVLCQGLKRQIRHMLHECGREVRRLVRTRIGPVVLKPLRPGEWRILKPKEVAHLRELAMNKA